MPAENRRRSFEYGASETTVTNKLKALIIAAASSDNQLSTQESNSGHHKNTTGIAGQRNWSDDEEVNRLWEKYSKPASNGIHDKSCKSIIDHAE